MPGLRQVAHLRCAIARRRRTKFEDPIFKLRILCSPNFAISPRVPREFALTSCPLEIGGRRQCRALDALTAWRGVRKTRELVITVTTESPGIAQRHGVGNRNPKETLNLATGRISQGQDKRMPRPETIQTRRGPRPSLHLVGSRP
jgi:hypothetical protein